MFKIILISIAVIIVIFLVVVATRPAEFTVRRSAKISAPPAVLFDYANDVRKWQEWSPWAKMDPNGVITYEGPQAGVGASFSWKGEKTGEGRMTNIGSLEAESVRYRLDFKKPFEATNFATFTFKPEGDATLIEWTMAGRNNFIMRAFGLFMNCDKMIGGEFEKGLATLKSLAESGSPAITTRRIFAVPRARLFEAFSDPAQLAKWWGPEGFSNSIHRFEFADKGVWEMIMHGPDGTDYPNEARFVKIEPLSKIMFQHLGDVHPYEMEMIYDDAGPGRSRLTWHMRSHDAPNPGRDQFVVKANEQVFDRLQAWVEQ